MNALVDAAAESPGVQSIAILQQVASPNHYEIMTRYLSENAYLGHRRSPAHKAFRFGVAPFLGYPYEERIHALFDVVASPDPQVGDFVGITQLEFVPRHIEAGTPVIEAIAEKLRAFSGNNGLAVLQRPRRPAHFELVSAWAAEEDFSRCLASAAVSKLRERLAASLVAPPDDRRHLLYAGAFRGE